MVDPIVATFVILALAMVGFVSGRVPIAIVAVVLFMSRRKSES